MVWDIQKLFRHHAKDIARSLRRRGLTAEMAADLTQDTFLRVLSSPPRDDAAHHNPKAYLYQVSRNLSINHIRRERLVERVELDDEAFAQLAEPLPSPETIVHDRQRLKLVEAALAELPARTRTAFEMHRLGDHTISEVARELDLSVTRTWTLIRDAYRHIVMRTENL
ncbi:RNA polymerase sigma-70 factor (ECF subfamily) [Bosea sp. BE125]|uniref:sigma-70 family RNA polymerase sigma factor n=1 Tax=Bosea sp. BE125 TaxID=2817909 RepID=UPI002865821F|nr:sigma-70 family RNA polymerase sigma factor [Bosea sp. BE125]MDR6869333.1 RNA polymerase sigma-70 factor (ECF subfamily) [Bosea sp. BE125]